MMKETLVEMEFDINKMPLGTHTQASCCSRSVRSHSTQLPFVAHDTSKQASSRRTTSTRATAC
jgi:hypothetical protein